MMSQVARCDNAAEAPSTCDSPLVRMLAALEADGIRCCVVSGSVEESNSFTADVDVVVDVVSFGGGLPGRWMHHARSCGLRVLQVRKDEDLFLVCLSDDPSTAEGMPSREDQSAGACRHPAPLPWVQIHFARNLRIRQRLIYFGAELIASRRRAGGVWVPEACKAFAFSLAKQVVKGQVSPLHRRTLIELYREDPSGGRRELERLWPAQVVRQFIAAMETGNWDLLELWSRKTLAATLLRRASMRHPIQFLSHVARAAGRRFKRWFHRDRGVAIVILGIDGSGKSSMIEILRDEFSSVFSVSYRRSFPPAWLRRGGTKTNTAPHAAEPRSWSMSVLRAVAYWFFHYSVVYYFSDRRALGGNALILHDRHLIDALVDPRRYRYGGPARLLRVLFRCLPRPELFVLLDLPVEIARSRKVEIPFQEVARQRDAYRQLFAELDSAHVTDASRPFMDVADDVRAVIVDEMARRCAALHGQTSDAEPGASTVHSLGGPPK